MLYCASIKQVKKVAMFFTLLMVSTFLQAESSDNADNSNSAATAETGLESAADDQPRDYIFPDWPERKQPNRQAVPPPPPGPYMSSALSDFSVRGPSFGSNPGPSELNKAASSSDPSDVPMETFSPDRPWIDHAYKKHKYNSDCPPACSPQRWMPENGYQYAPLVEKKSYPAVRNRTPMPGQRNMPDMSWSGSRLPSSRLPYMGSAPGGPYPYPPNYAPRNYGPSN